MTASWVAAQSFSAGGGTMLGGGGRLDGTWGALLGRGGDRGRRRRRGVCTVTAATAAGGSDHAAQQGRSDTKPAVRNNGMVRGSFHYAKPDSSSTSAAEQARYFVSVAGSMPTSGDLAPVLDLEETGGLSPASW